MRLALAALAALGLTATTAKAAESVSNCQETAVNPPADKVWPLLETGKLRPVSHQVFPAAEAAQAHALMESSAHIGKLVLRW